MFILIPIVIDRRICQPLRQQSRGIFIIQYTSLVICKIFFGIYLIVLPNMPCFLLALAIFLVVPGYMCPTTLRLYRIFLIYRSNIVKKTILKQSITLRRRQSLMQLHGQQRLNETMQNGEFEIVDKDTLRAQERKLKIMKFLYSDKFIWILYACVLLVHTIACVAVFYVVQAPKTIADMLEDCHFGIAEIGSAVPLLFYITLSIIGLALIIRVREVYHMKLQVVVSAPLAILVAAFMIITIPDYWIEYVEMYFNNTFIPIIYMFVDQAVNLVGDRSSLNLIAYHCISRQLYLCNTTACTQSLHILATVAPYF